MLWRLFAEALQTMQTSWYLLNLIKYYQRITRRNPYTRYSLNGYKDVLYIIVKLKELLHSWLVVTVYIRFLQSVA